MGCLGTVTLMGVGSSQPILTNPIIGWAAAPKNPIPSWGLGLIVNLSNSANLIYTVQVTGDPHPSDSSGWNTLDGAGNLTSSSNFNIAFPVTAVRLMIPTYTSGVATLYVISWP
jgi:hypothetical protein